MPLLRAVLLQVSPSQVPRLRVPLLKNLKITVLTTLKVLKQRTKPKNVVLENHVLKNNVSENKAPEKKVGYCKPRQRFATHAAVRRPRCGNLPRWLLSTLLLFLLTDAVFANVSAEQAHRLGTELTPMGANPAGNETGQIPPYTGKILGVPDWVDYEGTGTFYPNPYPDEKPLFVIDSSNVHRHREQLTTGMLEMFRLYPDTFRMPIYPSKRDTRYSDFIHRNTRINAMNAELVEDGSGVVNVFGGIPFPIPQNGEELAFNNQYAPNTYATRGEIAVATVYNNGTRSLTTRIEDRYFEFFDPEVERHAYSDLAARVMILTTSPAREKGKVILVHEYSNLTKSPRNAWQYLPGTRRVRRAPTISYDYPDGPGGLRTVDDALIFNGATDRFTWKMEGVRELYVPYNNNLLDDPDLSYDDILGLYHINPDVMRYELHRCWVVVGELKRGKRHIYSKRRMYVDEDSWAGLLAENYDRSGQLMRANMRTMVNLYDMPGMGPRVEIYHDLQKQAYQAVNLINEEKGPPKVVGNIWDASYFTPANLRKLGRR